MTGGRLKRVFPHIGDEEVFALTYGDGVANLDLAAELAFHKSHGRQATVAAVRPAKRFGAISIEGDRVKSFQEKPADDGGWINGGSFFCLPTSSSSSRVTKRSGRLNRWRRSPGPINASLRPSRLLASDGYHP